MRLIERDNKGTIKPGQDLVAGGYAGAAGARAIALSRESELLEWFSPAFVRQIQEEKNSLPEIEFELWKRLGASECEPAGEGGVLTALWNLSGAFGTGIEFDLHKIPVKQSTIEVCERYDLNPYRLLSDGCVILASDNGTSLVRELERMEVPAAVIGRVNQGIKREICHGQVRGFLDRPQKDELKKVVPDYFIK